MLAIASEKPAAMPLNKAWAGVSSSSSGASGSIGHGLGWIKLQLRFLAQELSTGISGGRVPVSLLVHRLSLALPSVVEAEVVVEARSSLRLFDFALLEEAFVCASGT